jgi:hypothetical protein
VKTRQIFSHMGSGDPDKTPALDRLVKIVGGSPEYIGHTGVVLRLRGLGQVQVRLDNGAKLNIYSRHVRAI